VSSFDEYLARVPEPERSELEHVRDVVRGPAPDAEEATSYGMPAFKYRQRPLLQASKNHLSVFPFSPEAIQAARAELTGFDLSKGTVRFTAELGPSKDTSHRPHLSSRMYSEIHELRHSAADELWRLTGNIVLAKQLLRSRERLQDDGLPASVSRGSARRDAPARPRLARRAFRGDLIWLPKKSLGSQRTRTGVMSSRHLSAPSSTRHG
jgi:uncharacterized protein YdhG (YjbR/CyaY superfamily)